MNDCKTLSSALPTIFNSSLSLPDGLNVVNDCCSIPIYGDSSMIACDGPQGSVAILSLTSENLSQFRRLTGSNLNMLEGTISPMLGQLKNLESLTIRDSRLSGFIPSELARLTKLSVLDISNNNLIGPFPHELTALFSAGQFRNITITNNRLTGPIPFRNSSTSGIDRNCFDDQNPFNKSLSCDGKVWCYTDGDCYRSGKFGYVTCNVGENTCVEIPYSSMGNIGGLLLGLIIGGSIAGCVICVGFGWCCYRRQQQRKMETTDSHKI
ncbi:hypothetical protein BDR26DRAFT_853877 [Obelidium mucronatum]|nr:hypothetical protein BDR26DRAFT_853877 [Obelidium mucronatum]